MRLTALIAGDGRPWEAALVLAFEAPEHAVTVVRRCVDIVELLALASAGQAQVALIAADLRHLDADAVDRLHAADVVPVGVLDRDDAVARARLHALGVAHVVPADADPKVVVSVLEGAVAAATPAFLGEGTSSAVMSTRGFSTAPASTSTATADPQLLADTATRRGSVIAVWGPTGAPGRTTVAVSIADEIARLGSLSLLIDADVYGGVISQVLGLLDESAGLAALCRQAGTARLDAATLVAACWQVRPSFRVLTGIPRAQRWPEIRPSAIDAVLTVARGVADFVVVDCGFCLEADEELSFDSMAPRRNGATLAILDAADLILVVGAADPLGLHRLARGLTELGDAEVTTTSWVLLNKVRASVVPGDPDVELTDSLSRFTGRAPAALLPYDQSAADAAIAAGQTLAEARPSSPLRRAMVELAAGIAGVEAPRPRRHRRRG